MDSAKILSFSYDRRFGVEMEMNAFDLRDFKTHPLNNKNHEMPEGILEVANHIHTMTGNNVEVKGWHSTHNNKNWVIKPDSSCGMELCSPVSKGWPGLKNICQVAESLRSLRCLSIDDRCSLHLHVDVADCDRKQIANILTYWVKCESVFLDSVPNYRKRNQFCQCIGMTDLFDVNTPWNSDQIIRALGNNKYYTANCYHYFKKSDSGRASIEFRIIENYGCVDPYLIKNWIRLIVHFVECARKASIPSEYMPHDPWSGFCWLDPEDVMRFLGFLDNNPLSKGMEQTRNWFLARLYNNISSKERVELPGLWSETARKIAREQLFGMMNVLGLDKNNIQGFLKPANRELLYSNEYKN
ncbi:MAG: hypothetical protein DWQ19_11100 [Crenarchaeota archaeon]|nr:MAG: hypothetical protein DWQ19_11100 [Thermoproteota archaeon]